MRTETTLVVDEIVDETLRMNFNVTLHEARDATAPSRRHALAPPGPPPGLPRSVPRPHVQVPCEYLSVDVSDMTGFSTHNITKDILKWRLDSRQVRRGQPRAAETGRARERFFPRGTLCSRLRSV